jgi:ADP-ribose pyrophosphatase YjhB (NUDIX family)
MSLLTEIPAPVVCCVAQDERGRYVMGRLKGGPNDGVWSFAGGKIDPGESPYQAAVRELLEETDLYATNLRPAGYFGYDRWDNIGQHYVCMFYYCDVRGTPKLMEPDKAYEWKLVSRTRIRTMKVLPGIKNFFEERQQWHD